MRYDSELVKNKVKISSIVGITVDLKPKANKSFHGLCPFHKEKTPSFFVSDDRGTYHCFGCGMHGDVFSFVMETEGLNYKEALVKLANIAGVQPIETVKIDRDKEKNKLFLAIYEQTKEYYKQQLMQSSGQCALRYVKSRGLSAETIKKYELGFAPRDSSELIKHLSCLFQKEDLIEAGIIKEKNNKFYDPFYNRLIFPIKDKNSRVVGFGGRVIDLNQKPKYLNSAESKIFNKSSHLYGFDLARKAVHKSKTVLVVEGYMDVLSLANLEISNVVAPLGTAMKAEQVKFLWAVCNEPIICFDNDEAGTKAAQKIAYDILPYVKEDQSLKFMILKGGKDPDEIILNKGLANFRAQIDKNINLADFIFMSEVSKVDLSSPERKVLLRNNLSKLCLNIEDQLIKKSYQVYFRDKFFNYLKMQKFAAKHTNPKVGMRKYFADGEKNIDLYMLISFLIKFPKILENNEIFENFVEIDLPYNLDKIRKMIFDSLTNNSQVNVAEAKTLFVNANSEKLPDFFDNVGGDLRQSASLVERILKTRKMAVLRKQIADLEQDMLAGSSTELMQKILYLKKNEQEIEKDLVN